MATKDTNGNTPDRMRLVALDIQVESIIDEEFDQKDSGMEDSLLYIRSDDAEQNVIISYKGGFNVLVESITVHMLQDKDFASIIEQANFLFRAEMAKRN